MSVTVTVVSPFFDGLSVSAALLRRPQSADIAGTIAIAEQTRHARAHQDVKIPTSIIMTRGDTNMVE